jgi:hypothetical protein
MNSSDSGSRRPRVVIVGAGFGGLSAAKQQGRYVAKLLLARAAGKMTPPFRYRDFGSMATIGRKRAVAQIGCLRISGLAAWLLWSLAHIYFLIGFRNRLAVTLNWAWNYITFPRGTRLITGISGSRIEDVMPVIMQAPSTAVDSETPIGNREPILSLAASRRSQASSRHV